ncbi:MAG: HNH endonuclease [Actinobacteria bacterium]|nr:HNH endonuclease [Actinomycetota bacterium]
MSGLSAAMRALREALSGFEPALLSGEDCAAVAEELARTEKACAGVRAAAAARAAECGAHRRRGWADGADWLAQVSGTSRGEARAALETVASMDACPVTRAALAAGEVSLAQAGEIAKAEAVRPGSEVELVGLAKRKSYTAVRDEARKVRLAAVEPEELRRRQVAARSLRWWRDELGMVRLHAALTPEVGIPLVNRLEAETDRIRRRARSGGSEELREAHAADAFVKLTAGKGRGKAVTKDLVVVCDRRAWARGHAHEGEPCHIVGGGPIPVRLAKELGQDAFVKAVIHDGVAIDTVVHFGRRIRAELRTALELGPAPGFEGAVCSEGCGRRWGLEWDHIDPVANGGPTSLANLGPRCWPDHRAKTERDRRAGLLKAKAQARAGPGP